MINLLKHSSWLLFAAAMFFTLLGQRGLNEPDEGRYAEIAREMSLDGDWLIPHMNGLPHFQKPPVIYWFTALSLQIFGHNEWAARLPSALMALGTVTLVFMLARLLLPGRNGGENAALVLTTLAGFFAMSRLLTPDMTMTFWITAAITAAVHQRHWLFFILMGTGFLTKGPMALVVPISAILGWQVFCKPHERLHLQWWRGLALTLAISLCWFVMLSIQDPSLFEYFWRYELMERFGSANHGRAKPFWFFLVVLPLATLPWILTLPLRRIWKKCCSWHFNAWQGLLLGWTIPPLIILSFSGSKLPTYVLPLMPAFALTVAATSPDLRRSWSLALPTAACLLLGDFVVAQCNEHLGVQASSRELAQLLRTQETDEDEAILFACETRTEGLAFYTEHLMNITRREADCVMQPTPVQAEHIYPSLSDCIQRLTDGPPAHGIVKTTRFEKMFDQKKWRIIGRSGAFCLVANHPIHTSAKKPFPHNHIAPPNPSAD
ncbi:glycosyltransferase family 39 protein [Prosthecobacter algae]|uniref:ArnT family glycosyltransferase n=1 Tax=Prosthecobacter algae TaxID=1144682 RepID=UPI0031ED0623